MVYMWCVCVCVCMCGVCAVYGVCGVCVCMFGVCVVGSGLDFIL